MAIQIFQTVGLRREIGFVGDALPGNVVTAIKNFCGYEPFTFTVEHLSDQEKLVKTAAVILRQSTDTPTRIRKVLEQYAPTLLRHDCRVFVEPVPMKSRPDQPSYRSIVVRAIGALGLPPAGLSNDEAREFTNSFPESFKGPNLERLTPFVHVLGSPFLTDAQSAAIAVRSLAKPSNEPLGNNPDAWHEIAEVLRSVPPGPPPAYDLVIDAVDVTPPLEPEQLILVKRAFHDCKSVKLVKIENGRSGAIALRAFVKLRDQPVSGRWPYLYFVKLGTRSAISNEFLAYKCAARENIPFHLGPRLRMDRCALGSAEGIIVSDYVAEAEPLKDCARDGRALAPIAHLFNVTLRAWHSSAEPERVSLRELLRNYWREIPDHRRELIKKHGGRFDSKELFDLLPLHSSEDVFVGAIHGDLHATNVLVRGGDAILIDFEKSVEKGPLLWDLACLEGGLFVDGFINVASTGSDLLASVRCLYEKATLTGGRFPACHPSDGSAWFFDCVHQIRMRARQLEGAPGQYASALGVALARKGCIKDDFASESRVASSGPPLLSREDVRALAYVLAEMVLVEMSQDLAETT